MTGSRDRADSERSGAGAAKALAVITARSRSKGLPSKNIRPLDGMPLIFYSIRAALSASLVERVIVSTDGEEIAEISKRLGSEVVIRPAGLAQDDSPTLLAVRHVLDVLRVRGDCIPPFVVVLQPTSPLRDRHTIDDAINLLLTRDCDSVMGVSKTSNKLCIIGAEGFLELTYPEGTSRQQMKDYYYDQGHIYVCKSRNILCANTLLGKRVLPFVVDKVAGIDIDDALDFELAELYLQHYPQRFRENEHA